MDTASGIREKRAYSGDCMKSIKSFAGGLYLIAFIASVIGGAAALAEPQRSGAMPNIVIILADDLGYGDPGFQNPDSLIETPNIDRIADEGMVFSDSHSSSSVCTPTRYALLTGRYAWRTRLKKWVLFGYDRELIEPDRLTVASILKSKGYNTGIVGKWHLGMKWTLMNGDSISKEADRQRADWDVDFSKPFENGPLSVGFDYFFGLSSSANIPPYAFARNNRLVDAPTVQKPDSMPGRPGLMRPNWNFEQLLPRLTEEAENFIRKQKDGEPFFLYFPLTAPHTPIVAPNEFKGTSDAGPYGDLVKGVDWSVGRVMAALREMGVQDNTLLIFTSDNGSPARAGEGAGRAPGTLVEETGHSPNHPLRGLKADIWEAGHRIPFLAKWPARIPAGTTSDSPIDLVDIAATIAEIVDFELPPSAAEDSVSILSCLYGKELDSRTASAIIHHSGDGMFAVRQGDWKLIEGLGSGGFSYPKREQPGKGEAHGQLYNLENDLRESDNLWLDERRQVAALESVLAEVKEQGRRRLYANE